MSAHGNRLFSSANAQQNDISKEYVEQCIKDVKSIINGIHAKAVEKSGE